MAAGRCSVCSARKQSGHHGGRRWVRPGTAVGGAGSDPGRWGSPALSALPQWTLPLATGLEPHLPGLLWLPVLFQVTDSLLLRDAFNSARPPGKLSLPEKIFEQQPGEISSHGSDGKVHLLLSSPFVLLQPPGILLCFLPVSPSHAAGV